MMTIFRSDQEELAGLVAEWPEVVEEVAAVKKPALNRLRKGEGRTWHTFMGGNKRKPGGRLSRFRGTGDHANRTAAGLETDHPAMVENRTLFKKTVKDRSNGQRILVSGNNNAKIGLQVTKGPWKGTKIYTMTLEERATCPLSCSLLAECYGNSMPFARRNKEGLELERDLEKEVRALIMKHGTIAVRLHVLGDFYNLRYVGLWLRMMTKHKSLKLWGYTAHLFDSEIGRLLTHMNYLYQDRCSIRFTTPPENLTEGGMQASTIWFKPKADVVPQGQVCPQQLKGPTGETRTHCCGTCGLCWEPDMKGKNIVFIGHGMRGGRVAGQARLDLLNLDNGKQPS